MIGGAILFMPVGIIDLSVNGMPEISSTSWIGIFYLAIGTSVISYMLWFYALGQLDATKVSVFSNSQPVFTTILAVLFLSQPVTAVFVIGGVVTIAGVIITQKK